MKLLGWSTLLMNYYRCISWGLTLYLWELLSLWSQCFLSDLNVILCRVLQTGNSFFTIVYFRPTQFTTKFYNAYTEIVYVDKTVKAYGPDFCYVRLNQKEV